MANFCGGSFSFPRPRPSSGSRGNCSPFHAQQASLGRGASARSRREPQLGVGQWGRQQLSFPAAPAGHGSSVGSSELGREREGGGGGRQFVQEGGGGGGPNKTTIKDLSPHLANTSIAGVVIMKHSICSFPDKRNPGAERFKFSFTLRDSPEHYINVTCWASSLSYVTRLHASFKICDVVEIVNGQVLSKPSGEAEDRWNAWTPTPYLINVSETYSTVSLYSGPAHSELSSLAHAPLRPAGDCHTLSSLLTANRQGVEGSHVSIMAAIRSVGKVREMMSKRGKKLKKCEVKLMDRDCPSFSLLIWDEELIELAQTWTPKENIIMAVDVKATYDSYRNCMTVVCDQKTLIITNPDCAEAYQLYHFSQSVELGPELSDLDFTYDGTALGTSVENIQSISEVFTIEELKGRQEVGRGAMSRLTWDRDEAAGSSSSSQSHAFTGILFAYLTQLNIAEDSCAVVCYRCSICKFKFQASADQTDTTVCSNKSCPSHLSPCPAPSTSLYAGPSLTASDLARLDGEGGAGGGVSGRPSAAAVPDFNLQVSLSDCTGELEGVWLSGQVAKDLLNISPEEFLGKTEDQRIAIKNSLLLEKFKIYFKSGVWQADKKKPPLKVLSASPADPIEAASHMQVM